MASIRFWEPDDKNPDRVLPGEFQTGRIRDVWEHSGRICLRLNTEDEFLALPPSLHSHLVDENGLVHMCFFVPGIQMDGHIIVF